MALNPDTPLTDLTGLPKRARQKLAWLGAQNLRDLAENFTHGELRRSRGIGPATLDKLASLLEEAGLRFGERSRSACAILDSHHRYEQAMNELQRQAETWVRDQHPQVIARKHRHKPGAYGEYLQTQLQALDHINAEPALKHELQNRLVRQLNRYEKEIRRSRTNEALRDGLRARS